MTGIRLDPRWLPSEYTPLKGVFSALTITPVTVHTQFGLPVFPVSSTGPLGFRPYTLPPLCLDLGSERRVFRNVVFVFGDTGKRPGVF